MLCTHFTQNCIFLYFLETKNSCFVTKNCWKSYICVFILSKKRRSWFHKNLHNSGMVGCRKMREPSSNRVFNALSIGVQYTLSIQWTNFGLKCLLTLTTLECYISIYISNFIIFLLEITIVTRNNIVWKLARGYCLCYCKTFSLVPDSTECTKIFVTEKCSALFVPPKIK